MLWKLKIQIVTHFLFTIYSFKKDNLSQNRHWCTRSFIGVPAAPLLSIFHLKVSTRSFHFLAQAGPTTISCFSFRTCKPMGASNGNYIQKKIDLFTWNTQNCQDVVPHFVPHVGPESGLDDFYRRSVDSQALSLLINFWFPPPPWPYYQLNFHCFPHLPCCYMQLDNRYIMNFAPIMQNKVRKTQKWRKDVDIVTPGSTRTSKQ